MSLLSTILVALELVLATIYGLWVRGSGKGVSFASPWALLLFLPLLWVGARVLLGRRMPMLGFSYTGLMSDLPQSFAEILRPAASALGFVGIAFLIIAAARPQAESGLDKEGAEGIDVVFALDLSGSMEAADFKPNNRLFVAKEVLTEVIQTRKSDRLGLVVFAGEAYTQVPLTLDYNVLINLLGELRTGVIKDGTAIGDALGTAVNRLRDQQSKTKVIILLTDGDNNAGTLPPLEAASIAAELGIRIYTILIGKDGPVPFPRGVDLFGQTVYGEQNVPINPALLKQIAEKTKALYFRAEDRDSLRLGLQKALDHLDRSRFEEAGTQSKEELFGYFLWVGLALVALERMLGVARFAEALEV